MEVFVVITFTSYGEVPTVAGVYTSQAKAEEYLENFISQSLAHSGFIQPEAIVG